MLSSLLLLSGGRDIWVTDCAADGVHATTEYKCTPLSRREDETQAGTVGQQPASLSYLTWCVCRRQVGMSAAPCVALASIKPLLSTSSGRRPTGPRCAKHGGKRGLPDATVRCPWADGPTATATGCERRPVACGRRAHTSMTVVAGVLLAGVGCGGTCPVLAW